MLQESTSKTVLTIDKSLFPYHTYQCVIAAETSVGLGPYGPALVFITHEHSMWSVYLLKRTVCNIIVHRDISHYVRHREQALSLHNIATKPKLKN